MCSDKSFVNKGNVLSTWHWGHVLELDYSGMGGNDSTSALFHHIIMRNGNECFMSLPLLFLFM